MVAAAAAADRAAKMVLGAAVPLDADPPGKDWKPSLRTGQDGAAAAFSYDDDGGDDEPCFRNA